MNDQGTEHKTKHFAALKNVNAMMGLVTKLQGAKLHLDRIGVFHGPSGYSPAVVSQVLRRKYNAGLATVEERVRGALMGSVVECPVWGEIGRDRCLTEQALPFSATSSARAQCYRACRSGCPHSRLPNEAVSRDGQPGKDRP